MEIDELTGRKLDITVYEKLHGDKITFLCADSIHVQDWFDRTIVLNHYSTDIAAAWELDGEKWDEKWEWNFEEWEGFLCVQAWTNLHNTDHTRSRLEPFGESVVEIANFPTKAAAYAIARCRAWLKACKGER